MPAWTKSTITTALTTFLICGSVACGTEYEYEEPDDFPSGSGQELTHDEMSYAPGPYGFGIGSTVPNFGFWGYAHPESEKGGPMRLIHLAEFFNPTGDGVYPPGSAMPEGTPKPLTMLVSMSAVWCPPCNQEAASILPSRHSALKPRGGEFLVNLADSMAQGVPANQSNLDGWIDSYVVEYPLVLDPGYKMMLMMSQPAWPANYIVDTRTMRIAVSIAGSPDAAFWTDFDDVLDGTFAWPE